MKFGIYLATAGTSIGGAELSGAKLAERLVRHHQVDLLHHRPTLTAGDLEGFFDVNLGGVCIRSVPLAAKPFGDSRLPWRRYREAQNWQRTLSAGYDVFINFTHQLPPFCHAKLGVLMILFPLFDRHSTWPWAPSNGNGSVAAWERGRQLYYDWEWKKRIGTYRIALANSQFTSVWTKRRWDLFTDVVYPPVDTAFDRKEKNNLILSVGRFATAGHSKNQVEMVDSFHQLQDDGLRGWQYFCVGGLGKSAGDHAYYEKVQSSAEQSSVTVTSNVGRQDLKSLFERSKIFWHAAGYHNHHESTPELEEHFGIATVEAMAAGCVPVVANRGGQREIVEHGVSGFLWETTDDLRKYTTLLAHDEGRRATMSEAARLRAALFTSDNFVDNFRSRLAPFFGGSDLF